jgi:lipopolysaccharide transport system ATP-binding protein
VHNQESVCVFSSIDNHQPEWHGVPRPAGTYTSTLGVPKSLLPDGTFNVTILLWEHGYVPICTVQDAVSFEMVDSGEVRGDYFRSMSGIIRPLFEWRTARVDGSRDGAAQ